MRGGKTDRVGEAERGGGERRENNSSESSSKTFLVFSLSFFFLADSDFVLLLQLLALPPLVYRWFFSPPLKSLTPLRLPSHSEIHGISHSAPLPGCLFPITTPASESAVTLLLLRGPTGLVAAAGVVPPMTPMSVRNFSSCVGRSQHLVVGVAFSLDEAS